MGVVVVDFLFCLIFIVVVCLFFGLFLALARTFETFIFCEINI